MTGWLGGAGQGGVGVGGTGGWMDAGAVRDAWRGSAATKTGGATAAAAPPFSPPFRPFTAERRPQGGARAPGPTPQRRRPARAAPRERARGRRSMFSTGLAKPLHARRLLRRRMQRHTPHTGWPRAHAAAPSRARAAWQCRRRPAGCTPQRPSAPPAARSALQSGGAGGSGLSSCVGSCGPWSGRGRRHFPVLRARRCEQRTGGAGPQRGRRSRRRLPATRAPLGLPLAARRAPVPAASLQGAPRWRRKRRWRKRQRRRQLLRRRRPQQARQQQQGEGAGVWAGRRGRQRSGSRAAAAAAAARQQRLHPGRPAAACARRAAQERGTGEGGAVSSTSPPSPGCLFLLALCVERTGTPPCPSCRPSASRPRCSARPKGPAALLPPRVPCSCVRTSRAAGHSLALSLSRSRPARACPPPPRRRRLAARHHPPHSSSPSLLLISLSLPTPPQPQPQPHPQPLPIPPHPNLAPAPPAHPSHPALHRAQQLQTTHKPRKTMGEGGGGMSNRNQPRAKLRPAPPLLLLPLLRPPRAPGGRA